MSIFFPELDIKAGEVGFEEKCALGRAVSGRKLSELVEKISEPVVIAVDGPWGSGKSHFLKLWTGAHKKDNGGKAKVIYFDAFKHDYFDDPLVALVGQIFEDFSEGKMKTLLKQASRLVKPATRIALAAATGLASEAMGAVAAATTNSLGKEAKNALDPVWENEANRREAMEGFKTSLKELTIGNGSEDEPQKIVIIIDELDRCRPDFALDMLEIIKHFFSVENVIFVLGVNLVELENSVKARYGGATNAGKYLQKFVHIRFRLNEVLGISGRHHISVDYFNHLTKNEEGYIPYLQMLLERPSVYRQFSLRDVQQLLTLNSVIPKYQDLRFHEWVAIHHMLIVSGLMIFKIIRPDLLEKARLETLTYAEVDSVFEIESEQASLGRDSKIYEAWKLALEDEFIPTVSDATRNLEDFYRVDNNNPIRENFVPLLIAKYLDDIELYE